MQDPYKKVSQRLQVVWEGHRFDISSRLWQNFCDLYINLNAMDPPRSLTYHIVDNAVYDVHLLEQSSYMRFLNNQIPTLFVTENHNGVHNV